MSLQEELDKSRKALGLGLLCALIVVYGGVTVSYGEGTWFYSEYEFKSTTDQNPSGNLTEYETEGTAFYKIDEMETEWKTTLNGDKSSGDDTPEYDDNGFEDREDLMKTTKNLALLSILLVGGLLAITMGLYAGQFEDPKEYLGHSKNLCLGLIAVCLLNASHFALNYPDAWQDDTSESLVDYCGIEDDPPFLALFIGKCENKNTDKFMPGYTGDYSGAWHPGPAWFITFSLIPAITVSEYYRLKRIEESGALAQYEQAQVQKQRQRMSKGVAVPVVPEPETIVPPEFQTEELEMKSVKCPECGTLIDLELTGKHQDIKCPKCGAKGEVTF
jgi:DNA-directed RNA polymerase subunit RPC12/RpoP